MSISAPAVIWRISDGRAGHDTQSIGLVEALQRRLTCRTVDVPVQHVLASAMQFVSGAYKPGHDRPAPTLIIGAGRRTHLDMLAARRRFGGRCIVIMRPSLPRRWFDLCLIPEHDQPQSADNVIATKGALNRMRPGQNRPQQGLVLVGGPSRHHDWDENAIIAAIERIIGDDDSMHWTITDSPRTPATTSQRLARLTATTYQSFQACPPDWLATTLPQTGVAWVSEDSVSMIYEALSAGCHVGVLDVPRRTRHGRVTQGVDNLVDTGYVVPYKRWQKTHTLLPSPTPLREADRCAAIIAERCLGGRS